MTCKSALLRYKFRRLKKKNNVYCVLNTKLRCCGYNLKKGMTFSRCRHAAKCTFLYGNIAATFVSGKYHHKMENIVCVRPFQPHSFHIRSEKKHPFEMKPVWRETRNRTSDGFTYLILTGGLTGATSYSSPSLLTDQYQESGHYAPLKALRAQSICYYFSSAGCI